MRLRSEAPVSVNFWGVRGSIPSAGHEVLATGGNTACVEIRCGSHILLFDAGTGLRKAGLAFREEGIKSVNIFLSHGHYDHIIGLPFFAPLFDKQFRCVIWSGHMDGAMTTEELVGALLRPPFFPAGPEMFQAETIHRDFKAGDILRPITGINVLTAQLDHPGGVIGYRIEYEGRIIAYMTDTGPGSAEVMSATRRLADRADMVIYDCMYTEEEAHKSIDFGHSTWRHGVDLCKRANAKSLAMFHHAPGRDDDSVDKLERMARSSFPGAFAARENKRILI